MKPFYKKTNIDFSQEGAVLLHSMAQDYAPLYTILEVTSKNNTEGVCEFSVGTNAPHYDNIIHSGCIFPHNAQLNERVVFNSGYAKEGLSQNDSIYLNITTPFSGTFEGSMYGVGFDPLAEPTY